MTEKLQIWKKGKNKKGEKGGISLEKGGISDPIFAVSLKSL